MAQIDVTIVIDTEAIVGLGAGSQDSNNPTQVNDSYIYMVTDQNNALSGQGGGELRVGANPGDEIRWQATSSTLASVYTVALYEFSPLSGGALISKPELNVVELRYFYPSDPSSPLNFTSQVVNVPYWSANINKTGDVTYRFFFTILNSGGHIVGYYSWDPYIHIDFPS